MILGHKKNGFGPQVIFDPELRDGSNGHQEAERAFGQKYERWCWAQVTVRPEGARVVISFRVEADAVRMREIVQAETRDPPSQVLQ